METISEPVNTELLTVSWQKSSLWNTNKKNTFTVLSPGLSSGSFIQCAVVVEVLVMLRGGPCAHMLLHNVLTQAQGTVGRVLNHSCRGRWRDREILFSAYLGIYCSTECNITIQKQDPNHTKPTIPLSLSSSSSLSKLHYITTNSKKNKKPPVSFSLLAQSRSGYWSLIRWIHYQLITNCFITQCNNAGQWSSIVLSGSRSCQCSVRTVKCYWVDAQMQLPHFLLGWEQITDIRWQRL